MNSDEFDMEGEMNGATPHDEIPDDDTRGSTWPYGSLLVFGFFGSDTPAGRRLMWRTSAALVVIVVATIVVVGMSSFSAPKLLAALLIPASVLYMMAEQVRYLRALDELARLLQLQALAFAYGCVMTIGAAIFAVSALGSGLVPAGLMLLLLVAAEPLRAAALAGLARRHE